MILKNHEKQYIIIRKLDQSGEHQTDQYICRELNQPGGGTFRIMEIPPDHSSQSMPYLVTLAKNRDFTDFVEFFSDGTSFYVVLKESELPTLEQKLTREACSFREKLDIGKQILKQMILLDMPVFFMAACLDVEHIHVAATGDIAFTYDMSDWYEAEHYEGGAALSQLAAVWEFLFAREMKAGRFPDMADYISRFRTQAVRESLEAYRWYQSIYEEWKDIPEKELMPETLAEKIMTLIQKLKGGMKIAIAVLLVMAAAGYLGYSIWNAARPDAKAEVFREIGTLQLTTEEAETE